MDEWEWWEEPEPAYEEPAPTYEEPAPTYDWENPYWEYEEPEPSYEEPAPTYEEPAPTYRDWVPGESYYEYLQGMAEANPNLPGWAEIYGGVGNIPWWVDVSKPWKETLYEDELPESMARYGEPSGQTWQQAISLGGTRLGDMVFNPYTGNWVTSFSLIPEPEGFERVKELGYSWNPFKGEWELEEPPEEEEPLPRQRYYPWSGVSESRKLSIGTPEYEAWWPFRVPKRRPIEYRRGY